MAKYCLECMNKALDKKMKQHDVVMAKELDCCENCNRIQPIVVRRTVWRALKNNFRNILKK